jgi:1-deoxy-D-xylulose-5-phosphate reductoisomerase
MGAKITIDSSTLMNKGLEVIEAHELFGVGYDDIDVVVHPQSIVHSMVEFHDGATIAQLSMPDMRLPIGLALGAPARLPQAFGAMDWATTGTLTFEPPDLEAFPCLTLAYAAGRAGGSAPAILSGANEVANEAFRSGIIPWTAIAEVSADALEQGVGNVSEVADVLEADRVARERATAAVSRIAARTSERTGAGLSMQGNAIQGAVQ